MELRLKECGLYRVKKGQTLSEIARTFLFPARFLAAYNKLTEEVRAGQVIVLPARAGNLYRVRGGESKSLLCGSPENFRKRNGTPCLYPTQEIFL